MVKISKNKIIYNAIIALCVGVILYNSYILLSWYIDKNKNQEEIKEIAEITKVQEVEDTENIILINPPDEKVESNNDYWNYIKMPLIDANVQELKTINSDTVGFVSVRGTNINYPVVQASDNNYYLTRSFKKAKNRAGWIFMDYRNNSSSLNKNTIIYGHNMIDGTMFGTLKNILKSDWITNKDNYIINLSTENQNTMWQVFSVYVTTELEYYIKTEFESSEKYEEWLREMLRRSEYNFNATVNANDKVLTLSTCYGASSDNKRVVMQAKLIKSDS
ncbi:MAG: class B sortase [Lachnospiraceae bacterium]|jgi:sortase B|nr:class B sortase [Lachnospiraceae bacterium]